MPSQYPPMRAISVILISLIFLGCIQNQIKSDFGHPFDLKAGQTASIGPDNLLVTFNGIIADSRCPSGVECIWAGQAVASFDVAEGSSIQHLNVTKGTEVGSVDFTSQNKNYTLRLLAVEPYPTAGSKISLSDYNVTISVLKK